jgi:predicted nucleic acid-binding protein
LHILDTTVASAAVNTHSAKHAAVRAFLAGTPLFADQLFLSAVTLAELRFGAVMLRQRTPPPTAEQVAEVDRRVQAAAKLGALLPVTDHVASEHAALKLAYARKFAPNLLQKGALKGKPPELWHEGLSAAALNVTENDLWIAATAIAHDLTLLTIDNDHARMRLADPRLRIMVL